MDDFTSNSFSQERLAASDDYKQFPKLAAYIDRIDAEQLNFRAFMKKDYKAHYYVEKTLIKISPDGDVICDHEEYAPTDIEAKAIKEEFQAKKSDTWPPKAILASNIDSLLLLLNDRHKKKNWPKVKKQDLYPVYSRKETGIIMVQQRVDLEGRKFYLPWCLWSDNKWRNMEPNADGRLPFFKPPERNTTYIMIHEGAKAAAHVQWLCFSKEPEAQKLRIDHPWVHFLKQYDHWGMLGGALAPNRADVDEVIRENPAEVIYVCDNDFAGKAMISQLSKRFADRLKCSFQYITFDQQFPPTFDLADQFPRSLFNDQGLYIGPLPENCTRSATWATRRIEPEEGKPYYVLRPEFINEWFFAIEPPVFVNRFRPDWLLSEKAFNTEVRAFSHLKDTASHLITHAESKTEGVAYEPAHKPGLLTGDGGLKVNTHQPAKIKSIASEPAAFLEYMRRLIPDDRDRHELMRWCATLIAKPEIRMQYGVILISEQQGGGR